MGGLTIAVANLKGGTTKTTTAVYLAHAFLRRGFEVLLVDADPQGSALRWSESAEWELPTIGLPVKNLHSRLPGIVPASTQVVMIDTPPLDEQSGIVHSALRSADVVLVTIAPTMLEYERLPAVWRSLGDVEPLRATPPVSAVLLNRTVPRANSTGTFRDLIVEGGHVVLEATIPRREQFAQAFGAPVGDLGPFDDAAGEILMLAGAR